jgi:hypothetical protein
MMEGRLSGSDFAERHPVHAMKTGANGLTRWKTTHPGRRAVEGRMTSRHLRTWLVRAMQG